MVEFCPECSSLLRKRKKVDKDFLTCKCGYEREIGTNTEEIKKEIQKKEAELKENLIVVSEEDKISVNLKVNENKESIITKRQAEE